MKSDPEQKYGFPVISHENAFSVLSDAGIGQWPVVKPPIKLSEYQKQDLDQGRLYEIRRFAPDTEVVFLRDPEGDPFVGFRSIWSYAKGCVVFTLLPGDLIPVAAEYRHGAEVVSLILPGGVVEKNDSCPAVRAQQEFQAETGIILDKVVPLDDDGIPLSARQMKLSSCSFLGILPSQIKISEQRLDPKEYLKIVLIPLSEWLILIETSQVKEAASIVATFLALRKLRRLELI